MKNIKIKSLIVNELVNATFNNTVIINKITPDYISFHKPETAYAHHDIKIHFNKYNENNVHNILDSIKSLYKPFSINKEEDIEKVDINYIGLLPNSNRFKVEGKKSNSILIVKFYDHLQRSYQTDSKEEYTTSDTLYELDFNLLKGAMFYPLGLSDNHTGSKEEADKLYNIKDLLDKGTIKKEVDELDRVCTIKEELLRFL